MSNNNTTVATSQDDIDRGSLTVSQFRELRSWFQTINRREPDETYISVCRKKLAMRAVMDFANKYGARLQPEWTHVEPKCTEPSDDMFRAVIEIVTDLLVVRATPASPGIDERLPSHVENVPVTQSVTLTKKPTIKSFMDEAGITVDFVHRVTGLAHVTIQAVRDASNKYTFPSTVKKISDALGINPKHYAWSRNDLYCRNLEQKKG